MKDFFELSHFRELKTILFLEAMVIILILLICHQQHIDIHFSFSAAFISLICWVISSIVDPKRYLNFFTLVVTGVFGYGVFWFAFSLI